MPMRQGLGPRALLPQPIVGAPRRRYSIGRAAIGRAPERRRSRCAAGRRALG
jgi:hypothetical protein